MNIKPGMTIKVCKTIDVAYVNSSTFYGVTAVRSTAGGIFYLDESTGYSYEVVAPSAWPPVVGDIWESRGTEYVSVETPNGIVLRPLEDNSMYTPVLPLDYEDFLKTHPVLVRESKNR